MELRLIVMKVNRFLESKVYGFLLNLVDEILRFKVIIENVF